MNALLVGVQILLSMEEFALDMGRKEERSADMNALRIGARIKCRQEECAEVMEQRRHYAAVKDV